LRNANSTVGSAFSAMTANACGVGDHDRNECSWREKPIAECKSHWDEDEQTTKHEQEIALANVPFGGEMLADFTHCQAAPYKGF
jgi:hypothetical protein